MKGQGQTAEVIDEDTGEVSQSPAPFAPQALATQETAISAVAAQARAMIEARYVMALHRPRDLDTVRVKLLAECKRPGFAESARYRRPVGKKKNDETGEWQETFVEGPSIRFAEAAMRYMGNLDAQSPVLWDDDDKRIINVVVTDLETNASYSRPITIDKTAEQRTLRKGQKALGQRTNSYGDMVYLVRATEAQIELKQAAASSKALRTLILRLLPGDILEECMVRCVETKVSAIKADPDAARKRTADAFAELGVSPAELKAYVGQDLASCSPAQLADLRDLYLSLKDGITTWAEVKRAKAEDLEGDEDDGKGALDSLRERTRAHAERVKAEKAAATAAAQQQSKPEEQPKAGK